MFKTSHHPIGVLWSCSFSGEPLTWCAHAYSHNPGSFTVLGASLEEAFEIFISFGEIFCDIIRNNSPGLNDQWLKCLLCGEHYFNDLGLLRCVSPNSINITFTNVLHFYFTTEVTRVCGHKAAYQSLNLMILYWRGVKRYRARKRFSTSSATWQNTGKSVG